MHANEPQILCPVCPECGQPPPWIHPSMHQAFCFTEGCAVLAWVPWETAAANLRNAGEATVTETPAGPQEGPAGA